MPPSRSPCATSTVASWPSEPPVSDDASGSTDAAPAAAPASWRMPSETAPHDATWMAWPSQGYTLGETPQEVERARSTWAAVANAVADFERVRMAVVPADLEVAGRYLRDDVELVPTALDDAWMRDIGPSFVDLRRG